MYHPSEKTAELQAEHDWILWKMEEHRKWKKTGNSEYCYSLDPGEYQSDLKRLSEIKVLLKTIDYENEHI